MLDVCAAGRMGTPTEVAEIAALLQDRLACTSPAPTC
jgi:hypothetical protein